VLDKRFLCSGSLPSKQSPGKVLDLYEKNLEIAVKPFSQRLLIEVKEHRAEKSLIPATLYIALSTAKG
jgi:hypothetical protein